MLAGAQRKREGKIAALIPGQLVETVLVAGSYAGRPAIPRPGVHEEELESVKPASRSA